MSSNSSPALQTLPSRGSRLDKASSASNASPSSKARATSSRNSSMSSARVRSATTHRLLEVREAILFLALDVVNGGIFPAVAGGFVAEVADGENFLGLIQHIEQAWMGWEIVFAEPRFKV